jgi:hypothetical protein
MWKTVTPVVLEECKEEAAKLKVEYEALKVGRCRLTLSNPR